jgi:protoheme IX farnesyltransferase
LQFNLRRYNVGKDDYIRGGYRMLSHPIYDPTGRRLAGVALRNSLYMLPLGLWAVACGLTTAPFVYEAGPTHPSHP